MSIKDERIKSVKVNGVEVSKQEALKIKVFDVDTSIITFDQESQNGTMEIRLTKK